MLKNNIEVDVKIKMHRSWKHRHTGEMIGSNRSICNCHQKAMVYQKTFAANVGCSRI